MFPNQSPFERTLVRLDHLPRPVRNYDQTHAILFQHRRLYFCYAVHIVLTLRAPEVADEADDSSLFVEQSAETDLVAVLVSE